MKVRLLSLLLTVSCNIVCKANPADLITSAKTLNQSKEVRGIVTDSLGTPLSGVSVIVKGTVNIGTQTDVNGRYILEIPNAGEREHILVFSLVGYSSTEKLIGTNSVIDVTLNEDSSEIDEVVVVAFGKQKKSELVGSVTSLNPSELRVPSSNLTTALAGKVSGMIAYQRSGEPGEDNASFFVRGVTSFSYARGPLILIDGVEMSSDDLARLQPDDISGFSIMKDAAATALYGARGANGVILVTTKEGREGKATISFRTETSLSSPTRKVDLADPITYMKLNNEAIVTRNPVTGQELYPQEKIERTGLGANSNAYPAVDWYKLLFKDVTANHRSNFNVSGGGKVARYYIAATYSKDNGVLNVDQKNDFNSNIDLKRYLLRSNVNINITNTTEAVVRLHGTFDDYIGPIDGGAELYRKAMRADPVLFPAYYDPDNAFQHSTHILFGNATADANYINPYADMLRGYKEYSKSLMLAQFEVNQNLDFLVDGLKFSGIFSTNRYSYFDVSRAYSPFYYSIGQYDKYDDVYNLVRLNPESGSEWLSYTPGQKTVNTATYLQGTFDYSRLFSDKHRFSGMLVYMMRNYLTGNAESLQLSLPNRNLGVSGRMTYSYADRYFAEANFGYNGSERFARNERFGFFPSIGLAWNISNEPFWKEDLKRVVSNFKLRATYGIVGNDAIGSASDRFFYLSEVNLNDPNRAFVMGTDFSHLVNGVTTSRYENDKITWEISKKLNLGAELELFKSLTVQADYYSEYRSNILMARSYIPAHLGLQATPMANVGEASASGVDISLDYQKSFNPDFWISSRANFTFVRTAFKVYEDLDNSKTPWLSKIGWPISQQWGYVAERLFVDEADRDNSPIQDFGEYMGGDIKYKDINNDDRITGLDMVPIGFPTEPEITYGFGFSLGFKKFDVSCFFQGLARESFWIDPVATAQFIDPNSSSNTISKNALLDVYAQNHWSENNRDIYALWPRLSDRIIDNNTVRNTWFMRDGSFLRFKQVELGYTMNGNAIRRFKMNDLRIYFSGTNLFALSNFKLWDPEMAGDGLGYPVQRVFNIGVRISL